MDTSKNPNSTASQQDYESDSSDSTRSSNSENQDHSIYSSNISECSNPDGCPLRSPGTWDPAKPRTMSMEYAIPEDLNVPEMLFPDPYVEHSGETGKGKELLKAGVTEGCASGLQLPENYRQRAKVNTASAEDAEYSPKTCTQNAGNPFNDSKQQNEFTRTVANQPQPKWTVVRVLLGPVIRYPVDFTPAITTVTISLYGAVGTSEEAQLYPVQCEINFPQGPRPGVPWYPMPKPPPYQPRPR